jgi:hypothetical protein
MPLYMKLIMLALASFLSGCAIKSTVEPPSALISTAKTAISPGLLKEELELIKQHLIDIHPQPFYRLSRAQFEQQYQHIKQSIRYPLNRSEFYLKVAPLLASLKDAHSFIELPLDAKDAFKYSDERLFPLAVIVETDVNDESELESESRAESRAEPSSEPKPELESRLYVAADLTRTASINKLNEQRQKIPAGAEILAINQIPSKHLLKVMRSLVSQETLPGQSRKIQMSFSRMLAAMGHASEHYQIDYLWQGQQYRKRRLGLAIRAPVSTQVEHARTPSYYGFSQLNPTTALLWLNDFNQEPEEFKSYLKDKFSLMQARKVKHLILDLRFNSGGLTQNLTELLSYLTEQAVPWATVGNIRISDALKQQHFDKIRKRRKHKYNWSINWLPLEWTNRLQYSVWWNDVGESISVDMAPIQPKNSYRPQHLYVLSNGFCYSACSYAQAAIKANQLGVIIGEKSGSLVDVQFAYPVKITLPHSHLSLTLATTQLKLEQPLANQLLEPDIAIKRTQQDIIQRRDPTMIEALKLISL